MGKHFSICLFRSLRVGLTNLNLNLASMYTQTLNFLQTYRRYQTLKDFPRNLIAVDEMSFLLSNFLNIDVISRRVYISVGYIFTQALYLESQFCKDKHVSACLGYISEFQKNHWYFKPRFKFSGLISGQCYLLCPLKTTK